MLTNEPFCKVLQKNAMFTLLWTRSNRSFKHDSLTIKTQQRWKHLKDWIMTCRLSC